MRASSTSVPGPVGSRSRAVVVLIGFDHPAWEDTPTGRAILNEIQVRLNRDVTAGAVSATLERLEAKGLASSTLAPAIRGGRARRYFAPMPASAR